MKRLSWRSTHQKSSRYHLLTSCSTILVEQRRSLALRLARPALLAKIVNLAHQKIKNIQTFIFSEAKERNRTTYFLKICVSKIKHQLSIERIKDIKKIKNGKKTHSLTSVYLSLSHASFETGLAEC